jgi:TolB-like protein
MGDGVNIAARLEGIAKPGAICLSEDAYRQVKARLDLSVRDLGATTLKNIAEPIRVYSLEVGGAAPANRTPQTTAAVLDGVSETPERPDQPSIAVLLFQNMSGDPEQEYFADGMVEDIITALSRFKSLFVIARNSSFTYKGRAVDIKQVGRELGVRYVLEGSVRKAGDRVRITGQLVDGDTSAHLWADRFDGSLEDVFELQDQVTTRVVTAIAPKITQAEIERARRKPAGSLDSNDLYLRALALSHLFTPESLAEAVAVLCRAMEIDPSYAPAAALSLFCFSWWHSEVRGERPQTDEAVRLARHMMANATDDPDVLWMVGWCLAYLAGETEAGASLIERGVTLNPELRTGVARPRLCELLRLPQRCGNRGLAAGDASEPARSAWPSGEVCLRARAPAVRTLRRGHRMGRPGVDAEAGLHQRDDRAHGGLRAPRSARGRERMGRPYP